MQCERTRCWPLLLAALVALVATLGLPAAGHAAEGGKLASAGTLARGSGYDSPKGSEPVRTLQRRLRRLGQEPGPIDGLYGPLTEGAVERFQQRHGLAVDGIVGRQTKRSLLAQPDNKLERKSPAPQSGAESAIEPQPVRPAPTGVASRDGPDTGTDVSPGVVGLIAGLAGLLMLAALWRLRGHELETSFNLGLACAALLGVFGIGAVAGALFASRAAPEGVDEARAQSGVLLARAAVPDRARSSTVSRKRTVAARPRPAVAAPPSAPGPAPVGPLSHPILPAPARAAPAPRANKVTYVVQPGDSLSAIARKEVVAGGSGMNVAERVAKLAQLNIDRRIRSGDPNMIDVGEELRLP
jgi:putative peptidoglycan binding protein/LysM domain-containing protein